MPSICATTSPSELNAPAASSSASTPRYPAEPHVVNTIVGAHSTAGTRVQPSAPAGQRKASRTRATPASASRSSQHATTAVVPAIAAARAMGSHSTRTSSNHSR
ncbi:MAG: hypothetical protein AMS19_05515 [Gemmatimonas sp. SG8_23]|nr:MAG: hypothetical protein AMS19_05515 [Gemmatimonas sp. SG8_23]